MRETDRTSRRRVLKIAGAAGATALVAGCTDGNGNGEDPAEEEEDPAEEEENGMDEEEEDPAEDEEEDPAEDEEEENGNGEAIEPDTQIVLDAQTAGWVGVEPEEIADDENPTITLQDGESYEIGWEEGDGSSHNIELVDDSDEVVDDYETEEDTEGGDDQFIEFDATDEIVEYVCRPHEGTMRGSIEIGEGNGNGAAEDEEEEENGMDEEEEENGMDEEEEENGMDEEEEENGMDEEEEENGEDEENN
jgi:plastocyanin